MNHLRSAKSIAIAILVSSALAAPITGYRGGQLSTVPDSGKNRTQSISPYLWGVAPHQAYPAA